MENILEKYNKKQIVQKIVTSINHEKSSSVENFSIFLLYNIYSNQNK